MINNLEARIAENVKTIRESPNGLALYHGEYTLPPENFMWVNGKLVGNMDIHFAYNPDTGIINRFQQLSGHLPNCELIGSVCYSVINEKTYLTRPRYHCVTSPEAVQVLNSSFKKYNEFVDSSSKKPSPKLQEELTLVRRFLRYLRGI